MAKRKPLYSPMRRVVRAENWDGIVVQVLACGHSLAITPDAAMATMRRCQYCGMRLATGRTDFPDPSFQP